MSRRDLARPRLLSARFQTPTRDISRRRLDSRLRVISSLPHQPTRCYKSSCFYPLSWHPPLNPPPPRKRLPVIHSVLASSLPASPDLSLPTALAHRHSATRRDMTRTQLITVKVMVQGCQRFLRLKARRHYLGFITQTVLEIATGKNKCSAVYLLR